LNTASSGEVFDFSRPLEAAQKSTGKRVHRSFTQWLDSGDLFGFANSSGQDILTLQGHPGNQFISFAYRRDLATEKERHISSRLLAFARRHAIARGWALFDAIALEKMTIPTLLNAKGGTPREAHITVETTNYVTGEQVPFTVNWYMES